MLNQNLVDMGFENYSPIMNVGGLILQFMLYGLFLVIAAIFKFIISLMEVINKDLSSKSKKLREMQD